DLSTSLQTQLGHGVHEEAQRTQTTELDEHNLVASAAIRGEGTPHISDLGRTAKPSVISDLGNQLRYTLRRKTESIPLSYDTSRSGALEQAIIRNWVASAASKLEFFPEGQISRIVNEDAVKAELRELQNSLGKRIRNLALGLGPPIGLEEERLDQDAARICGASAACGLDAKPKSFRKILAILLLIDRPSRIRQFVEEGVCDDNLPLELVRVRNSWELRIKGEENRPLQCFKVRGKRWRGSTIKAFERTQWHFLAPFFGQDSRRMALHFKVPDSAILPFIDWQDIGRQGSFSKVYRVRIHPDHHAFHVQDRSSSTHVFAVKKLLRSAQEDEFRHEFDMLRRISRHHHPHLISLLATYEQFDNFHLIFPLAESDLEKHWRDTIPKHDYGTVLWMAEQLMGLAGAVAAVHSNISPDRRSYVESTAAASATSPGTSGLPGRCRHGDIKPKNILCFSRPSENSSQPRPSAILKLTDFGAAQLMESHGPSSGNSSLSPTTPNYRAPEADLIAILTSKPSSNPGQGGVDSRHGIIMDTSYDIWSLGCVFLEFIAWFFGPGWERVEEFLSMRSKEVDVIMKPYKTGKFFVIDFGGRTDQDRGYPTGVRIRPGVEKFIHDIHNDSRTSRFFHDLLRLIRDEMLVIEHGISLMATPTGRVLLPTSTGRRRSSAEAISKKLAEMLDRGREEAGDPMGDDLDVAGSGYQYFCRPYEYSKLRP
ncbi:kinase-like domain containing protein, partial [Naviculisporaceae sp. PSN 640]